MNTLTNNKISLCSFDNCIAEKIDNSEYCIYHICRLESCFNSKRNGGYDGSNYCEVHNCNYSCCHKMKKNDKRCAKHKCMKCDNILTYNSKYCEHHACKFCGDEIINNEICICRICHVFGCNELKKENSLYCKSHGCYRCGDRIELNSNCDRTHNIRCCFVYECYNTVTCVDATICNYHKCIFCTSPRLAVGLYCKHCDKECDV